MKQDLLFIFIVLLTLLLNVSTTKAQETIPARAIITSPGSQSLVTLQGNPSTLFSVHWKTAQGSTTSRTQYILQISPNSRFKTLMVNKKVGNALSAHIRFGKLDTLLQAFGGRGTFYYRVLSSDGSQNVSSSVQSVIFEKGNLTAAKTNTPGIPNSVSLSQNYPNPFNPTTNIEFDLNRNENVTLAVYNILGQKVATLINNQMMDAGSHTVRFDASKLSSGLYLYQLNVKGKSLTKKMTLLK